MLVVVNQPHINNFTIQGTISAKDLAFLKNHFGENLIIENDDDELVDFHDTDWFKEVEEELTPASVPKRISKKLMKPKRRQKKISDITANGLFTEICRQKKR